MSTSQPIRQTITTNTDTRMFVPGASRLTVNVGAGATVTLFDYDEQLGKGAAITDSRTGVAYTTTANDVLSFAGGWLNVTTAGIAGTVTIILSPLRDQTIPQ
jgi:hypothetical protein